MADHLQLDEGASGKYAETEEVSTNIHRQSMKLAGVGACKLKYQGVVRTSISLGVTGTDYAAAANVPAGTKYVTVYCTSACQVAIGEATSATCGVDVGAGMPTTFPLLAADVTTGRAIHARGAAGTVVYLTYQGD